MNKKFPKKNYSLISKPVLLSNVDFADHDQTRSKIQWRERIHGSKLAVHLSGSCMAMLRSTPDMGGPLTSTHRQGWPRALRALQQALLGGMGLKGATAALHGIS